MSKYKVIVGIDEEYTLNAILNCFKNRKNYEIHVYNKDDKHQKALIDNLFFDVYWLEYEYLDFENLIYSTKKPLFNTFVIRKGLIRKAQLAYYLNKHFAKRPNSPLKNHIMETYVFELDYIDYFDESLNEAFEVQIEMEKNEERRKNNERTVKFILKSSLTNKGAELFIFDSHHQLYEYFESRANALKEQDSEEYDGAIDLREWVIQRYMDNPLLIDQYGQRKFHLRVYILALGNLNVYVYERILCLFSLKAFEAENFDTKNLASHITNTCYQYDETLKTNSKFEEKECIKEFWTLELSENIKYKLFEQIKEITKHLFEMLECEKTVYQPVDNAFELYGFDFLVDSNYQCYFLEANAFPDFKQTGEDLNSLINCLFYQTVAVCVDRYLDNPTVCDSDKLHLVYQSKIKN